MNHPHLAMFQDFAVGTIMANWEHICSDDQLFTNVWSLVDIHKANYSLATSFNLKEIFENYFHYNPANTISVVDLSQRWQKICAFLCSYFSAKDTLNVQVGLAQAKLSNSKDRTIDSMLTAVQAVVEQFNSYVLKSSDEKRQKRSSITGLVAHKITGAVTKKLSPKILLAQQLQAVVINELKHIKSLYQNIERPEQDLTVQCHRVFSNALYALFSEKDTNLGVAPDELLEFTNDLSVGLRRASASASNASILISAALLSGAGLNPGAKPRPESNDSIQYKK